MSTIEVSYDEFRKMGKTLLDALPTGTEEEIEAGWKCFVLAYFGLKDLTPTQEIEAPLLVKVVGREKLKAEFGITQSNAEYYRTCPATQVTPTPSRSTH